MRTFSFSILALLLFISIPAPAQNSMKAKQTTFTGYLVDRMCGSGMSKKSPEKAMMMAAKHTRMCAMAEDCAASGYGVVYDGTWHAFDKTGTKKAAAYLDKIKAKNHLYVAVTGTQNGDMIDVASIKTAKEPKMKMEESKKMEKKDDMKMKKMD